MYQVNRRNRVVYLSFLKKNLQKKQSSGQEDIPENVRVTRI